MAEDSSDGMNLDLNLDPGSEQGLLLDGPIMDELMAVPLQRFREAVMLRARQRLRLQQFLVPPERQHTSVELDELMVSFGNGNTLQPGEGSVTPVEREVEVPKICENNNGFFEGEDNKVEKGGGDLCSFFDCNICLDLALDPVLTCCGHLFCWSCLYRWLMVHSEAKECPVCKGGVTIKNVTPIYGRGNNIRAPEEDTSLKIPRRPHARRVESWRQTIQRTALTFPVEETIRRHGSRFDLVNDMGSNHDTNVYDEIFERNRSLLNRILTSRGLHVEEDPVPPPDEVVDLTHSGTNDAEVVAIHRPNSLLIPRSQSQRTAPLLEGSSTERLVNSYFSDNPTTRNQEQRSPFDDRDSFSSITVTNPEGQTVDTAADIDSLLSVSTSSSRRRSDASRVSPRAFRRRRFN